MKNEDVKIGIRRDLLSYLADDLVAVCTCSVYPRRLLGSTAALISVGQTQQLPLEVSNAGCIILHEGLLLAKKAVTSGRLQPPFEY